MNTLQQEAMRHVVADIDAAHVAGVKVGTIDEHGGEAISSVG